MNRAKSQEDKPFGARARAGSNESDLELFAAMSAGNLTALGVHRAEDAAFLVILALQRAGRGPEAVDAARRYLGTYAAGYRRAEAQAIVEAP